MKRSILLLGLLFGFTFVAAGQCGKTLKVGWRNWTPFAIGTNNTSENPSGFDVEILQAIMKAMGCRYYFTKKEIPWKRQLFWLKDGNIDLVFGVPWNSESSTYGIRTELYRSNYVGLFIRRGQIKKWKNIKTIDELSSSSIRLGVVRGYSYGIQVDKQMKSFKSKPYPVAKPEQVRQMLIKRRFDGYLAYLPDESIIINDHDLDHRIQLHPMEQVVAGGVHFLLSQKSTDQSILNIINKGLSIIKSNGKYDKIKNKYAQLYGITKW